MTTSQIDDGGQAYPGFSHVAGCGNIKPFTLPNGETIWEEYSQGLTKREHFAGLAISEQFKFAVSHDEMEQSARRCFAIADMMIAAGKAQP